VTALAASERPLTSELASELALGGAASPRTAVAILGAMPTVATAAVTLALTGLVVVMVVVMVSV
jgi:hypothetical protein